LRDIDVDHPVALCPRLVKSVARAVRPAKDQSSGTAFDN
jgi:hypothetical protein